MPSTVGVDRAPGLERLTEFHRWLLEQDAEAERIFLADRLVQEDLARTLESLDSFYTPNDEFFTVKHYGDVRLSASAYRLAIEGLVAHPQHLSLAALKGLPHRAVDFTLECSGDNGLPFIVGAVGNARWGGTPLHSLLRYVLTTACSGPLRRG